MHYAIYSSTVMRTGWNGTLNFISSLKVHCAEKIVGGIGKSTILMIIIGNKCIISDAMKDLKTLHDVIKNANITN